jgi:hypothetical protein
VLLDSGAFTAFNAGKTILLADYIAFLKKWGPSLFGYMLLDKLQDPVQTEANWQTMLAEGLTPVPIHVYGEGKAQMDAFFERSPYVALGGLRRPHRGAAPPEYVKLKMEWAAGRPVHWLGYTDEKMVRGFRPFSVDCASAWSSMQFGQVQVYLGAGEWWLGTIDDWKELSEVKRRELRRQLVEYDVEPAALDQPETWRWQPTDAVLSWVDRLGHNDSRYVGIEQKPTSHVTASICIRSWVRYIFDVRRNFGTRVFLASTADQRFDRIIDAALVVAHRRGWDRPLGVAP